ncbi:MAG: hypothetical protein FJ398_08270 [Verrucomicrobia bacterium]|nr:hypothetical protein [Verrucomicrobiota bacterium]
MQQRFGTILSVVLGFFMVFSGCVLGLESHPPPEPESTTDYTDRTDKGASKSVKSVKSVVRESVREFNAGSLAIGNSPLEPPPHPVPLPLAAGEGVRKTSEGQNRAQWEQGQSFRSKALVVPPNGQAGFTLLSSNLTGIAFGNFVPEARHLTNQILLNGSGVAAGDVDGDGWCDLYFCGLNAPNRLYRNLGHWKFEDITEAAGVACTGLDSTGATFADLDGDGDLDLIVNSIGRGTRIFFNDGKAIFAERTVLNPGKGGMTTAIADTDGDGFLDLYIANYRTNALMDMPNARATFKVIDGRTVVERVDGRLTTEPELTNRFVVTASGRILEMGQPDAFYRNLSGTNFGAISFTDGTFMEEDGQPLKETPRDWGLAAMFRDLNGDGWPDLYVCNDFDSLDRVWINQGKNSPKPSHPEPRNGPLTRPADTLSPSEGERDGVRGQVPWEGRFRAIPRLALRKASLFSMGVDFADLNRDGFDDFLVLDMLSRDHRLRMTQMLDDNPSAPRIGEIENRPQYGLNTLFLSRGDGTYAEIGQFSGLEASEWSWTPIFLDVDLDGWEDVLISNGQERAARDLDVADELKSLRAKRRMSDAELFQARRKFPRLSTPNLAFRNRGDLTFEETGRAWGFDLAGISHGMALADLDNDGDLDVAVNNFNALASVYRNNSSAPRIAVRLKGRAPNTRGIGARIKVLDGAVPEQSQEMICGGRYLSSDEPLRVFAAGSLTNELTIEVNWRSGLRSLVRGAKANRVYEIQEAESVPLTRPADTLSPSEGERAGVRGPVRREGMGETERLTHRSAGASVRQSVEPSTNNPRTLGRSDAPALQRSDAPTLFEEVSHLLNHTHRDQPFDDFSRQPLLPNRLSQLGPGVAWFDIDADGWDDLIVGSGKGGTLAVYRNQSNGGFSKVEGPPALPATRDQTTVLGWNKAPGQRVLLAGSANYEDGLAIGACVRQFDLAARRAEDLIAGREASTGPLALADYDGDGDLDLFVGGRVLPGKYPEAASSALYRNAGGKFAPDTENSKLLVAVGLVSGAVFSDLTGDGYPELILACDWGPIRIFWNQTGRLAPWNWPVTLPQGNSTLHAPRSTLHDLTGWWNGVTAGDFDEDGKMDLVASNWGRNTRYQSHRAQPLRVYFGDFDRDGTEDIIEAYYEPALKKVVPERQFVALGRVMPFLRERFASNKAYAGAGVEELLGDRLPGAKFWEAVWLESTVFLNRGDRWEARALPVEAQFAPAFGLAVADGDGDGHEDLFLSQNLFGAQIETPRYDGGRGLWLRGDGRGGFAALAGQESGVMIYGEQRGCALADFDRDGRIDLAVAQNGAATKLFRNRGGRPGWRIRLKGPEDNPDGVGACLRLITGTTYGAAREIHSGSGYWSQDSSVQVMASAQSATRLWIRWPGGKETTVDLPKNAREVSVDLAGRITNVP